MLRHDIFLLTVRTKSEHYSETEVLKRSQRDGRETMKAIIEDILTVCTLLAMGTAIVMWGAIGQAIAG